MICGAVALLYALLSHLDVFTYDMQIKSENQECGQPVLRYWQNGDTRMREREIWRYIFVFLCIVIVP